MREAVTTFGVPAATGVAGIAGGLLIARTAIRRRRSVFGVRLPSKVDFSGVGEQIGEAGRQFGKLADEVREVAVEVRSVREKAEQIGKILN